MAILHSFEQFYLVVFLKKTWYKNEHMKTDTDTHLHTYTNIGRTMKSE